MRNHLFPFLIILLAFANMSTGAQTNTSKGTLVLGVLTVESSYAKNIERPSNDVPDTVQFWFGSSEVWRIRTYAMDHDIHVYSLGVSSKINGDPIDFARNHISKNYCDVLSSVAVLNFSDINNTNSIHQTLAEHKLGGHLEVTKAGFIFWKPDNGDYKTQTTPK